MTLYLDRHNGIDFAEMDLCNLFGSLRDSFVTVHVEWHLASLPLPANTSPA